MFKCRLPLLRLIPALHLLALPALLSSLVAYHQRLPQPRDVSSPSIAAVALAAFPPLWFFGFLYYTDVPGIAFVLGSFVAQANDSNWLAALVSTSLWTYTVTDPLRKLGLWSLFFRQTNIIWILYIFAYHNIFKLRWARPVEGVKLYDPPALSATLSELLAFVVMADSNCASVGDTLYSFASIFRVIPSLIWEFIPYGLLSAAFAGFVVWNGGIVLGASSLWGKHE